MKRNRLLLIVLATTIVVLAAVLISTNFFKVYPFDRVKDEAAAIQIAAKALGPSADDYPITTTRSQGDVWVVIFAMGQDYAGGVVEIHVNKCNGETGAIQYWQ